MAYSGSDFMDQAAPVGEFCRAVNYGYDGAYEWDKHDYGTIEGVRRERWGLDLTRVRCNSGTWGSSLTDIQNHVLYHIVSNAIENQDELRQFFPEEISVERHQEIARNISNAWRDEFALNDPINGNTDDRMRIAEWRIVQCYYAVFKGTSALMRACFDEIRDDAGDAHSGVWIKHRRDMMTELGNSLYAYPFMYFPQATTGEYAGNWFDWTVPYPLPSEEYTRQERILQENAQSSLSSLYRHLTGIDWTEEPTLNTFYDGLLLLRHWANYQHGGVFSRLYGEGYKQAIDDALRLLAFTGLAIAEIGLIFALGWRRFRSKYQVYSSNSYAGINDSSDIVRRRVEVYMQAFGQ